MKIEIAVEKSDTSKVRGDLLEELAKNLLKAQSYEVIQEIRFTGVELDLLCKHRVNGREIYVECKAHRENLSANILKNLAGTLVMKGHSEAWLISTAEFGKDAKGMQHEWNEKPREEAAKLSFYTPSLVISALQESGVITNPPQDKLLTIIKSENLFGVWTLLITKYGNFWAATVLNGGIPAGVILFYSKNGELVNKDDVLLKNISSTDTTLNSLDFLAIHSFSDKAEKLSHHETNNVVQVQHGDAWSDYRPARPQDFVGRDKDHKKVFSLFTDIRKKRTSTRVFAITGDSGMGKSSLINKIRDKAHNKRNKNKVFVFAVDIRAAITSDYIYASLLTCLKQSQEKGFGDSRIELRITDFANPLSSQGIKEYIQSLEVSDQLVCLIFDQFEELYSKPELFGIFERARSLFIGASAILSNFCLGFAWKSDSTTHNEHPAYFMWHALSDLRMPVKLQPFSDGDTIAALNLFQNEIGQKLHNDLRHNLAVSSQGYPWLLKKLCIHLYKELQSNSDQGRLIENTLDVGKLFDNDLEQLNHPERTCIDLIARRSPIDWYEVIDMSGETVLTSLINKRLVVRSGDRLNIYWDIFREYLLTKKIPTIPLHYLPTNEYTSVNKVGLELSHTQPVSVKELAEKCSLSERTVQNICSDLVIFGIANRESGKLLLHGDIQVADDLSLLEKAREKLIKHAFKIKLYKTPSNSQISTEQAVDFLKEVFPDRDFRENTWRTYTNRLCKWLFACGLLVQQNSVWVCRDLGKVNPNIQARRRGARHNVRSSLFKAPASPKLVYESIFWLKEKQRLKRGNELPKGYRNSFSILTRFDIIRVDDEGFYKINANKVEEYDSELEAIFREAEKEAVLQEVKREINCNSLVSGLEVGQYLNKKYTLRWSEASSLRNGRAIKQWASWLLESEQQSSIKSPPGRSPNSAEPIVTLFNMNSGFSS